MLSEIGQTHKGKSWMSSLTCRAVGPSSKEARRRGDAGRRGRSCSCAGGISPPVFLTWVWRGLEGAGTLALQSGKVWGCREARSSNCKDGAATQKDRGPRNLHERPRAAWQKGGSRGKAQKQPSVWVPDSCCWDAGPHTPFDAFLAFRSWTPIRLQPWGGWEEQELPGSSARATFQEAQGVRLASSVQAQLIVPSAEAFTETRLCA